jgi:hypothetical protein
MIAYDLGHVNTNSLGYQRLYRLDPPLTSDTYNYETDQYDSIPYTYVVVSAAVVPFSGPETYLFPADEHGTITDWRELTGSQRGTLDHATVLSDLGYTIERAA